MAGICAYSSAIRRFQSSSESSSATGSAFTVGPIGSCGWCHPRRVEPSRPIPTLRIEPDHQHRPAGRVAHRPFALSGAADRVPRLLPEEKGRTCCRACGCHQPYARLSGLALTAGLRPVYGSLAGRAPPPLWRFFGVGLSGPLIVRFTPNLGPGAETYELSINGGGATTMANQGGAEAVSA